MTAHTEKSRSVARRVQRVRANASRGVAGALLVALLPGCSSSTDDGASGNPDGGGKGAASAVGGGTGSGGSGQTGSSGAPPGGGGASSNAGGTGAGLGGTPSGGRASGAGGAAQSTGGTNASAGGSDGAGGSNGASGKAGTGGAGGAGGKAGTGGASGATSTLDKELLGVYCGNTPSDVTEFEGWVGRHVDGILGYTGNASWTDYDGSVGWAVGNWSVLDRRVLWSVPLIPTGATLADAAAGKYDDHYQKAAQTLSTYRTQEPVLYVRTGWEFNGNWFPWNAQGKSKDFAGAFQHFVTAFRGVSNRFRIEWNVNVGDVGMNPEDAYPGDSYVDIIGMDFYWNTQYDPADPAQAWTSMLTRKYGLNWHQDFAKTHGKPTAYSEWGIMSNNGASYIQQAKAWFASHDVVYQTYWNSDSSFTGKLSSGQYPNAGTAYKTAFGP